MLVAGRAGRAAARAAAVTIARTALRLGARVVVARRLDLRAEGLDLLPRAGPALIAARHYHHFYDGAALVALAQRPVHILVALDWVRGRALRRAMEALCAAAGWPVVLRAGGPNLRTGAGAYRAGERGPMLRRALRDTTRLLREGRLLVVFPEAYPNVDPDSSPKAGDDAFLPFDPGFVRLTQLAQRGARASIPVVPVGFHYTRAEGEGRGADWRVTLRVGAPLFVDAATDPSAFATEVEGRVRQLSMPPPDGPARA